MHASSDAPIVCGHLGIVSIYLQYVKCGIPQGSCLGHLLFLLFINDMPLSLHDSKVTMYADDSSLAYASSSIDDITKSMNAELENLRKWVHGKKLTLNVAKATSMIKGNCIKAAGGSSYRHTPRYQEKQLSRRNLLSTLGLFWIIK